jgi:threonine/homoserine/homoserine lactone efflux protein
MLVSMSNPYWWVWWASIGFAFMYQYGVSFRNPPLLIAFFVGHQIGDLAPYWLVSILVSLGRRRLNTRVYHVVLVVCGAVILGFGGYLAVSTYLRGV